MHILYDQDDYVTEVTSHICEHHKRQPWDHSWPGCTCSSGFSQRRATPEERAENIRKRQEEQKRREKHMADYDQGKLDAAKGKE